MCTNLPSAPTPRLPSVTVSSFTPFSFCRFFIRLTADILSTFLSNNYLQSLSSVLHFLTTSTCSIGLSSLLHLSTDSSPVILYTPYTFLSSTFFSNARVRSYIALNLSRSTAAPKCNYVTPFRVLFISHSKL